jgi:outer membrane protein insertion porin family
MRFGVFLDAGNGFDVEGGQDISFDEFRASTGVMLSWMSPIGPLTFSVAYPFKQGDDDEIEIFQFSVGAGF